MLALCEDIIDSTKVELIRKICHHIITRRAKSIRPMITFASALASGVDPKKRVKIAACVELIHTATLLHDDVLDGGVFRRGKATANKLWGNHESILIGDFLLSRAFHLVIDKPQVADFLASTSAKLVEGEIKQLEAAGNLSLSYDDYYDIVFAKTACLFAAAAKLGASPKFEKSLEQYGSNLGTAFQCGDDVLDYNDANNGRSGKNIGQDFKERKMTLPLLFASQNLESKEFWRELLQDPSNFSQAQTLMAQNNIFEMCFKEGEQFVTKAKKALEPLPPSEAKRVLLQLPLFALTREQ